MPVLAFGRGSGEISSFVRGWLLADDCGLQLANSSLGAGYFKPCSHVDTRALRWSADLVASSLSNIATSSSSQ